MHHDTSPCGGVQSEGKVCVPLPSPSPQYSWRDQENCLVCGERFARFSSPLFLFQLKFSFNGTVHEKSMVMLVMHNVFQTKRVYYLCSFMLAIHKASCTCVYYGDNDFTPIVCIIILRLHFLSNTIIVRTCRLTCGAKPFVGDCAVHYARLPNAFRRLTQATCVTLDKIYTVDAGLQAARVLHSAPVNTTTQSRTDVC